MRMLGLIPVPAALRAVLQRSLQSGRQILSGKTTWLGLFLILGYWPVVQFTPNGPQTEFLRIARTVVAIAISVSFLPGIVKALKTPWPTYGGQLVLGIVLSWTGVAGSAAWVLIWSMAGRPGWMLDSNVGGFFIWLQILGGTLHLTAHKSVEDEVPKPNWVRLGLAVAFGVLIGIVFMANAPDMHGLAEFLKPWFAEEGEQ